MKPDETIEALLFVADSPTTPEALAEALEIPVYAVEEALDRVGARLAQRGGVQLVRIAGGYQLCTKPIFAEAIARFLQPQKQRLSRSLLETLAIVAYKQPITLAEIDAVRGVQSDYSLRQLVERQLVRDAGRKESPGRPVLYATTKQFLHLFNLNDLSELPELDGEGVALMRATHDPSDQPSLLEVEQDSETELEGTSRPELPGEPAPAES